MIDLSERVGSAVDFEAFFRRAEPVLSRAFAAGFGFTLGHDAAAEALSYGWRHWDRLSTMDNPTGYLYRVGERWARRQRQRLGSAPDRRFDVEPAPGREPLVEPALAAALAGLTRRQRQVVVLVAAYHLSHGEVAELLGIARTSVQNHLERGLTALRTALGVSP